MGPVDSALLHVCFALLGARQGLMASQERCFALEEQLEKPVDVLDVTPWQRGKLLELGLNNVGDVLRADEQKLKEAMYVGNVRARRMRNAAVSAVLEYLSG